MSGFVGVGALVGAEVVGNLLFSTPRSIGTVFPHVVIEEHHRDDLVITEHPVEKDAPVTDHAFRRPSEVNIRCGFGVSILSGDFTVGALRDYYEKLVALQREREPMTVSTGKRLYENMLISSISVTTDPTKENILDVTCALREVIIVKIASADMPPQADQAAPEKTAGTTDAGTKAPVDNGDSILKTQAGGTTIGNTIAGAFGGLGRFLTGLVH